MQGKNKDIPHQKLNRNKNKNVELLVEIPDIWKRILVASNKEKNCFKNKNSTKKFNQKKKKHFQLSFYSYSNCQILILQILKQDLHHY